MQTVPRAETSAGIEVKKQAAYFGIEGPLGIISDAMYFVEGSAPEMAAKMGEGGNFDL